MAIARSGSTVKPKLNMLFYGEPGVGKSTMALQLAHFKREDGTPFRVLVLDAESGGCEECLAELEENNVDLRNIYLVYSQSQKEIKEYIAKVRDHEPFYELDSEGNELDETVKDAYGEDFYPDALILDGTSVLKLVSSQSLLDLSRKRNKIKAEKSGATAEEKFVAVSNANLELKDYSQLNYSGQDLVLSLMACGAHVILTAREKDETISIKGDDGKTTSVATGKKVYDSFKGMDYNTKTLVRLFRDDLGQVCAEVVKDRTRVYSAGEIIENPSLLAWESVIQKGKGKADFTLRNDLDKAIDTDQAIFEKQMLGGNSSTIEDNTVSTDTPDSLRATIKSTVAKLSADEKQEMKRKLTEAKLPTNFAKVTDVNALKQILAIVSE
jgi:DNA polymerase III delta prime subunit